MDQAVLDTYGWSNIPTDCDFLLDYEIDETTWGRKKKPYRYRCGPTPSGTKSLPASSPSTPNALRTRPAAARPTCAQDEERRQRQAKRRRAALAPDSVRPRSDADLNE